jgi:hypothetical protein
VAKYNDVTAGQTEACINRMRGWDNFLRFIGGAGEIVFKSILSFLYEVTIPASTERFVARKKFVVDTSNTAEVKIAWMNDDFQKHFLGKIEEAQCEVILAIHKLEKTSADGPIRTELGGDREVTTLNSFFHLLSLHWNKQEEPLLTDSSVNIFYCEDEDGKLWAVGADWCVGCGGWRVGAYSVSDPVEWRAGHRVVSCK